MTKCDFCTKSTSQGKCLVDNHIYSNEARIHMIKSDCEIAINKMVETLKVHKISAVKETKDEAR